MDPRQRHSATESLADANVVVASGMTALRISALVASALGFLSISLTGEIAPAWYVAGWLAWIFSWMSYRYPEFQSGLRRLETIAVMGMIAMLFLDFFVLQNSIFIAITHFLLLFQIVKLVGEKSRKDYLQIFLFSFFQVLASCTLSVDAWHAIVLIALIPTATATLFWNQMEREYELVQRSTSDVGPRTSDVQRNYRRMAALMCTIAIPFNLILTAAVFVIFPRLTLNASLPGFSGRQTGYTDQVNLAQKGNLRQEAAVVLWLSFPKSDERARWDGYLRGDVLTGFDGRQWSAWKDRRSRLLAPDSNGVFLINAPRSPSTLIHQTITLADPSAGTLFTIGRPLRVLAPLPALQEQEGGSLHWTASWRRPLRYEVTAEPFSDADVGPEHRQLPSLPLERIRSLAQKIAGRGPARSQAQNIEQFLKTNYQYSTNFGDRIAANPVESFLFERRQGSCGHFASAMALMLRLRHIPSRLVAGYFKGEWNDSAQCAVIRERDAHAWVEAYIEGHGWVAFDPTPSSAAGPVSHRSLLNRLDQYWDYLDYQWNRFVIQYDLYSQIKAFETMKGTSERFGSTLIRLWTNVQFRFHHRGSLRERSPKNGTKAASHFPFKEAGICVFLIVVTLLLLVRKRHDSMQAPMRFYSRFLERMARTGHPKAPHETGWEFAARLEQATPALGDLAHQVTEMYYQIRFRKEPS